MASQGPRYPGTVTTESVSTESANDWLTPGNIAADDAAEAQITAATYDSPDISFRLKAQNLGFTIPAGSTIDGITVEIDRRSIIASSGVDFRVQLLDAAGALVGANKASATVWPTASTVATYGGAADTWTASPTAAMVNDPDFGVVLSVSANIANADIGVDFIRVTVNYTLVPVTVTPSTASLVLTTFAPTVTVAAAGVTVTPSTAALTTATFAPTVTVSDHKRVTPGVASLTLAAFAPSVTATANRLAVPSTAALVLTGFAPTVTASGGADDDFITYLGRAMWRRLQVEAITHGRDPVKKLGRKKRTDLADLWAEPSGQALLAAIALLL